MLNYKDKKVLVTGGAGFIGSELVRQLSESGAIVTVVDNLVNGKRENIAGLSGVTLHEVDIRDRAAMQELMQGVEILFHLAALGVRHSIHSPEENHEVNANGALGLLIDARAANVGRFVCVSTSEIYGTGYKVPMDEEHPPFVTTVYGGAKLAGESYARAFYATYGYPTVVIRPFNTYGPHCHHEGDSGEVIPKFMLRVLTGKPLIIFGDGTQTRDFTNVQDTAYGILLAGLADGVIGETINIGNGDELTINKLAEEVAAVAGVEDVQVIHDIPRPGDNLRLYADISKAKRLLGYAPRISLADGLQQLKEWYLGQEKTLEELLAEERVHNWQEAE
jgi:UDP-glucose 4-epimerase